MILLLDTTTTDQTTTGEGTAETAVTPSGKTLSYKTKQ